MIHEQTAAGRIVEEVSRAPDGCLLEDLVLACSDLTWNQVFNEVDRLSRSGRLLLTRRGPGVYTVRLPGN